ncbi:secreted RxLR effector protein 161-like [Silene latifolia]|uniref:secreted RxLR effector protein 161-like n=1 Tax=Silene latifolia TaxID=37657 RepID=UPI003D7715DF
MEDCHPAKFPLPRGLRLTTDEGEVLQHAERPKESSQFLAQPRVPHLQAALHLIRYLKGTINLGLFYPSSNDLTVTGYCDADWGTCAYTGRSLTGYCVFLGPSLISWKTKKQATVSKSSAESEYRSMSQTSSELVWINELLKELHVSLSLPITSHCDNKAAQHILANPSSMNVPSISSSIVITFENVSERAAQDSSCFKSFADC